MNERRQFIRIVYQAPALVRQAQSHWPADVRDISLHGILLSMPEHWQPDDNAPFEVDVTLHDTDIHMTMVTELVAHDSDCLRMKIVNIDIDSISHLRRLIELNVGDDELLYRELELLADLAD